MVCALITMKQEEGWAARRMLPRQGEQAQQIVCTPLCCALHRARTASLPPVVGGPQIRALRRGTRPALARILLLSWLQARF